MSLEVVERGRGRLEERLAQPGSLGQPDAVSHVLVLGLACATEALP